ncbi:MAG: glycoside hydrolase family 32 protein [Oscillospiraceae bacterium]|nr:glycoside hydrolase family 32 protein [Oscillospiraceae bacterium]
MSDALQKARAFLETYLPGEADDALPRFHVTGGIGWLNDPNGFSVYRGEYHLFFQYHPYDTKWGPMHWGHVKTNDFIRWERLPVALAPDEPYDENGCFSGSALELPDGRHLLMYTGVRSERRDNGMMVNYQTQCIAIGDGVNYEKYAHNPVLTAADLPAGGSVLDFRDPKIWQEGERYYAVIGNRTADGSGAILLYESADALHWTLDGTLASCHNQYGRMWECPDFFRLDGRDVLLTSPQEMTAIGLEFHPGNGTVCLIGSYDAAQHHLLRENVQAVDYGIDFYAPQTLLTPDGRRVMIAWMQNWETSGCRDESLRFMGQMTLPRELHIVDGRLIQNPVRELERYRGTCIRYRNVMVCGDTTLHGIRGRCLDMTVEVRPTNENNPYRWFRMNVASDGERRTTIRYKPETGTIRVDRTHSGFPHDIVSLREFLVRFRHGSIKLRIVLDRYSLELFVNDGEQAASFVLYTPAEAASISFSSDGALFLDVEKYDLDL